MASKSILSEQVRLLYINSMLPVLVSVIVSGLLCWSLRTITSHPLLITWFSLFCTVSGARILLLFLFRKSSLDFDTTERWHRFFLLGTYAAAALWGSSSFFLFPDQSQIHQIMFCIIIVGLATSAVSSLYQSLPAVVGFLSLVLIPLVVKLISLGSDSAPFTGMLVLIILIFNLAGALKLNGTIRENIQLRLKSVEREEIIKASEERYRHIFDNAPLGLFQYDVESVIVDCNEEFIRLLGSSRKALLGLNMLVSMQNSEIIGVVKESLTEGEGYFEGDYESVTSSKITPIRAFFKAIKASDQTIIGGVAIVEDFTERKMAEQLIEYHASYDSLTGLPNRRLMLDHLNNEISRARRHEYFGALLFIDLDNFKTINDSLGHSVGDELLKVVAKRISDCIRQEDSAARMGGDEFTIILTELDKTIELAAKYVRRIAEKLRVFLSAPCQIEGHDLQITPSIGVSIFPQGDQGVDDILKQADTAMYRAKAAGRNKTRFFLPSMQEAADERLRLNTELRKALDKDELILYYQPQTDITGKIVGAEALLRWHHPERGLLPPGAFLSIAEETGLMGDIGRWVLKMACKQIKAWTDTGQLGASLTISVNISGKEFVASDFVDMVSNILLETGAPPKHLGIELTESSLISTGDDIVKKIMELQQMGIKFSVDDFGTGYSSLSYLKRLPLNTLKIDRSFVNDIKDASRDVVLVDTIIMMARNLGLEVIAEGVETEQELLYLNTKGCTVYQGYYFSKPVALAIFTEMLEAGTTIS